MRLFFAALCASCLAFEAIPSQFQLSGRADEPPHSKPIPKDVVRSMTERANFNLPLKTTGGTQIWTDHRWRKGYRVQQNALTGHWRLLNAENVRLAWGSESQCLAELEERVPREATAKSHYVVMLHGLMRTAGSMQGLEDKLSEERSADGQSFTAIRFSYASTRGSIGDHAAALRDVLEDLPPDTSFSFVGHSMGNIIVRHLIGDLQTNGDPKKILPRCKTMVMLGPPNQGASIARRLAPTKVFGWVTGKGGLELGAEWEAFEKKLAVPPFPFHIIAGDLKTPLANPLVEGNSDFVVSLEEAKLAGAKSFQTVPVLHSFLMDDDDTMNRTVELLTAK